MNWLISLSILFAFSSHALAEKADRIVVFKAQKIMLLISEDNRILKHYKIALGATPVGHKTQEGDEKTPEGRYTIDKVVQWSKFYRPLNISYPNKKDVAQAQQRGVSPGGLIYIHGLPKDIHPSIPEWAYPVHFLYNWTDGCIAVTNNEMDEIHDLVQVGTPIYIYPYLNRFSASGRVY